MRALAVVSFSVAGCCRRIDLNGLARAPHLEGLCVEGDVREHELGDARHGAGLLFAGENRLARGQGNGCRPGIRQYELVERGAHSARVELARLHLECGQRAQERRRGVRRGGDDHEGDDAAHDCPRAARTPAHAHPSRCSSSSSIP
ncbi:MAG: hypothetical protein ACJLS2_11595 [Microcella pacifica]